MTVPPTLVMPFAVVIPEDDVLVTLPIFAAVNVIILFEGHTLDLCVWSLGNIKVLGFPLRLVPFPARNPCWDCSDYWDCWTIVPFVPLISLIRHVRVIRVVGIIEVVPLVSFIPLVPHIGIARILMMLPLPSSTLLLPLMLTLLLLLPLIFLLLVIIILRCVQRPVGSPDSKPKRII